MLTHIKNKILDIESKISVPGIQSYLEETVIEDLKSPSFKRYTEVDNTITRSMFSMVDEINSSISYMNDVNFLINQFYNLKESQMQAFRDRYEVLALRKRVLNSYSGEDNITVIPLNDKNMFMSSDTFGIDESGMWFPMETSTSVYPNKVTILSDSNIKIGAQSNPLQNSKIEALWNDDQNDLFSIFREDMSPLKLCLSFSFSKKEIINEMEFEYIKNSEQEVNLFVRNISNQDILFNGPVKDYWIQFAKPALTDSLYVEIRVSSKNRNQFDLKKISPLKVKYRKSLKTKSIRMPIFSNKYLFYKDYTLLDNRQKAFLDFKVQSNSETLQNKDMKLSGPYKDPEFYIECSVSDMAAALDYLEKPKFKKGKSLPAGSSNKDIEYKVIEEIFTESKQTITHIVENSNRIFLKLPFPNLDDFFGITVNGQKQTRVLSKSTLSDGEYFCEYSGEGYTFYFSSLSVGTPVDVYLSTIPSYVYGTQIAIPNNGLGSTIGIEYAKELKAISINPIVSDDRIILGKKYIQKVIFKQVNGQEIDFLPVNKQATYNLQEYYLDNVEGIIYLNSNNVIGLLEVYYLETETLNSLTDTKDKLISSPDNMFTFNYSSTLKDLLDGSFKSFNLLGGVLNLPKASSDLQVIQLPQGLSLHYGSIRVGNKKETLYIDGVKELSTISESIEYFDFKSQENGIVTYKARNPNLDLAAFFAKTLSIEDYNFEKRVSDDTPVNEGDYYFDGNELYLKLKNNYNLTIPVKAKVSESLNVFSVDYSTNRIFVKFFNASNWYDPDTLAAVIETFISFNYSCIKVVDFTLQNEVPKKGFLKANEYFCYVSNTRDIDSLLPYFSPVIESIALGVIG